MENKLFKKQKVYKEFKIKVKHLRKILARKKSKVKMKIKEQLQSGYKNKKYFININFF